MEMMIAQSGVQGEQQGGTNYFYFRDHLGSVREMINASGTIVSEITYDPYGVMTVSGTVTPSLGFAGMYWHQGTGLNLTWYRAYDPVTGRWQSRDPLPNAERLQGPNLYQYVGNNPLRWNDPNGEGYWKEVFITVMIFLSDASDEPPPRPPKPPASNSCSVKPAPSESPTPSPKPKFKTIWVPVWRFIETGVEAGAF